MTIYAIYTGTDLNSYICELSLSDDAGAVLPVYRLQIGGARKQTGTWQDLHPSTHWGSLTIILKGRIEFGVTAGERRSVRGHTGDMFIFVDTQGPGHSTSNPGGGELFQVANMRFADSIEGLWANLRRGFNGWPDNILPPATYMPGGPESGRHTGSNPTSSGDEPDNSR